MSEAKPSMQVPLTLWGAFLVTHGLFLVMGYMTHGQAEGSPADLEVFSIVLTGVGVVTALSSALAVPILVPQAPWFTALLLRFSFAESTTIFGLVLAMMGAEMQWVYILTGLGALAHLAAFPSERDRDAHERRLGSRSGS